MKKNKKNKYKKPRGVTAKTWKLHLEVIEMNKRILKERKKNFLYVPGPFDEIIEKS